MSKKGAKTQKEVPSYNTRDIVLGKVRGYPPWPGMVVDPDTAPPQVSQERPTNKKAVFYCVQFFPSSDYAWLVAKDISKLQPHEIESYINEPYKKSTELLQGYRIALDPTKWEAEREAMSHDAVEEEANAEIDQLESENDDEDAKKKQIKTKKRKRDSEPVSAKPKKTTKTKKDSVEPPKKKSASTAGKSKRNGAKSKAMVESEDEGQAPGAEAEAEDDDAGPSKKASPPTKRAKREKEDDGEDSKLTGDPEATKVRDWRHKLQKTFLSNKALPKEEDMPALDVLFTTVENYDKITIEYLQFSKIGKVMRHIAVLPLEKVPRDAEFNFRERAKALVEKWHQILNANKINGSEHGAIANGTSAQNTLDREEAVTKGAAAIDLNGKAGEAMSASPVAGSGDMSVLADVTMSEA